MNASRNSVRRAAILPLVLLLAACAAQQSKISDVAPLAAAGIAYAEALPEILDESFELAAGANSLQLILSREALDENERSTRLAAADELLRSRLSLLNELKAHAVLLRAYFEALQALAGGDAGIGQAARDAVAGMARLRPAIADTRIGGAKIGDLAEPGAKLATGAYANRTLRQELDRHGGAIARELALQQAVVTVLVEQMKDDAELILQVELRNPVVEAYLAAKKLPGKWKDNRVRAFSRSADLQSLDDVARTAEDLGAAWIAFVEKRDTGKALARLIVSVEQLLRLAELLRRAQ